MCCVLGCCYWIHIRHTAACVRLCRSMAFIITTTSNTITTLDYYQILLANSNDTIQNNLLLYRFMCTIHSNVLGTVTLFAPHSLAPVCIQQQQQQKDTLIALDRASNEVEAKGKELHCRTVGWLVCRSLCLCVCVCVCMHYHFRENPTTFIVSQSHWNRRSTQSMLQTTVHPLHHLTHTKSNANTIHSGYRTTHNKHSIPFDCKTLSFNHTTNLFGSIQIQIHTTNTHFLCSCFGFVFWPQAPSINWFKFNSTTNERARSDFFRRNIELKCPSKQIKTFLCAHLSSLNPINGVKKRRGQPLQVHKVYSV